jgi:hypothetical protein
MSKELINVHHSHLGRFNTSSGKEIDIRNPTEDAICIEDIAHALSNICRFGGHCHPFYSVAQHSVIVAALAPPELQLAALLHDAAEAYLGDVIKPLKILLGYQYERYELMFDSIIRRKFGLCAKEMNAIKEYDKQALGIEHKALLQGNYAEMILVMTQHGLMQNDWVWKPSYAEHQFMYAYEALIVPADTEIVSENSSFCTENASS